MRDSGLQVLDYDSSSVELGFWILIVIGIPDSLSFIPYPKASDSGIHMQKFPDSRFHYKKNVPDFGIHIPLHGATCSSGSDRRMWACGAKSKTPFISFSHFDLSPQSERLKQARCFCDLLANKTVKA